MTPDFASFQRNLVFLLTCCLVLVTSVPKHPVILVPGITGSQLWQQTDKNGDFTSLWICPWDLLDMYSKITLKFDNLTGRTSNNQPTDIIQPCGFGDPYTLTNLVSHNYLGCESKTQQVCNEISKPTFRVSGNDEMEFFPKLHNSDYRTERLLQNIEDEMLKINYENRRTCDMDVNRMNQEKCLKLPEGEKIADILFDIAALRKKMKRLRGQDVNSHPELLGPIDLLLTILQSVADISCKDKDNTPTSTADANFFPQELFDDVLRVYGHKGKPHPLFKYVPDREDRVEKLAATADQCTCGSKHGSVCNVPDLAYSTAQQTFLSKDPAGLIIKGLDIFKKALTVCELFNKCGFTPSECDLLIHKLEMITNNLELMRSVYKSITEFATMVEKLEEKGFTPNKDLRGAPYDFRKAPYELTDYYSNLKKLIEDTSSANDNAPVVVAAHSMGNLVMRHFYNNVTSPEWRDRYVKAHVALGAPWAGAVKALKLIISGEDFGVSLIDRKAVRAAARSWPSTIWLLPQENIWDTPLVVSQVRNYTAGDYQPLFADLSVPYPEGNDIWRWIKRSIGDVEVVPQVKEVHVLYGTEVDTPHQIVLQQDADPEHVVQVKGGDGTVNLRSLEYLKDKDHPGINLTHQSFAGVDHVGILSDHRVLDFIVGLVTEGEHPHN